MKTKGYTKEEIIVIADKFAMEVNPLYMREFIEKLIAEAQTKVENVSSNSMLAERYSAIDKIKLARKLKGEEHDKKYEITGVSYTTSILRGQMAAYDNCLKWLAE